MRGGHVGGECSLATSISFLKPREIAIRGNRLDHSVFFFFFKQKTAYEISLGLVGSEMCIRDRLLAGPDRVQA